MKKIRTRFTPNELADVVNAYAEAGVKAPDLFETVSDALRERLSSFTADDACDVAFALSRARCVSDELLDAAVATHANTTATSAEALAPLCYASRGKACERGPGAATAARNARQAVENGDTLSLDSLSRCCWASAAIEGEDASVLFNECTKRVARCANDFTGKQLVTIAFAASKKAHRRLRTFRRNSR